MEVRKKFPVFMDVRIGDPPDQRMVFKLFYDIAPYEAENFRAFCTGEKGVSPIIDMHLCYRNCYFLPVKEGDSYVKGGVFSLRGKSGESIYGPHYPDEIPRLKKLNHDQEGLLSMFIRDREASHFVITLKADQSLDRRKIG